MLYPSISPSLRIHTNRTSSFFICIGSVSVLEEHDHCHLALALCCTIWGVRLLLPCPREPLCKSWPSKHGRFAQQVTFYGVCKYIGHFPQKGAELCATSLMSLLIWKNAQLIDARSVLLGWTRSTNIIHGTAQAETFPSVDPLQVAIFPEISHTRLFSGFFFSRSNSLEVKTPMRR